MFMFHKTVLIFALFLDQIFFINCEVTIQKFKKITAGQTIKYSSLESKQVKSKLSCLQICSKEEYCKLVADEKSVSGFSCSICLHDSSPDHTITMTSLRGWLKHNFCAWPFKYYEAGCFYVENTNFVPWKDAEGICQTFGSNVHLTGLETEKVFFLIHPNL